jgi:DNA-binding SARP family transcriptional activator/tetratricopeptide (TPR) repeat protein
MPGAMEFGLLGPLVVRSGETEVPVRRGHQRALLAILLLEANRPVPVEVITQALWGPAPPRSAPVAIRSYIRWLRLALGPAGWERISTQPCGYLIRVADGELDLARFEHLLASARAAARSGSWQDAAGQARAALSCWRGEPLADIESDTLVLREAPRLAELRLQAVETRIDADLRLGGHAEVSAELQHLCAAHPLREHLHALLMLALYRCGRQAEALAAYQHLRAILVEELGADPGTELQTLHQQILSADPALAARQPAAGAMPGAWPGVPAKAEPVAAGGIAPMAPRQLPATVAYFTGRAGELAALAQMLDQAGGDPPGAVVISAIGGMAGVGKTALAVRWAHQVAPRFGDGQLYVNLRGFDHTDAPAAPAEAIRGFLDALGVAPERIPPSLDAQAGLFRSLLAGRKMLIVLDNARDEQQVRPLLPAGPGCLVLVTSRRQLAGLAAADGARLLTLDLPSHAEARQMLTLRLGAGRAAAEPDAVDHIANLCARLPLALAVAAARAHARPRLSLAALAAELSDMASRLDALDAGDPAASVRAVFSWSYQQLSPEAARMFPLLGLHPGPDITVPAAASLTATALPAAGQALRELAAANLLTEHPPGRYTFHDLLRAYAAELAQALDDRQAREAATDRMLDHYLHTAHAAALLLKPTRDPVTLAPPQLGVAPELLADHQEALDWFEAEHRVLLAALALAGESGFDACAWQLPFAMSDFLERRGYWHESAAIQRIALAAATRLGDIAGRAMVGRALGTACAGLTDYDQARAHMTDSLGLYRKLSDPDGQARVHQSLAWAAGRSGRHRDALGHAEQALDLFQAAGNRAGQAAALNALGYGHAMLGDPQRARPFCRQALALNQELGLHRGEEAHAWDSLGYVEYQLGHHHDAADCYQSALTLFRELRDLFNEAEILTHLGDARHAAGDQHEARAAWKQALDILENLHHPGADQIRAKLAR